MMSTTSREALRLIDIAMQIGRLQSQGGLTLSLQDDLRTAIDDWKLATQKPHKLYGVSHDGMY